MPNKALPYDVKAFYSKRALPVGSYALPRNVPLSHSPHSSAPVDVSTFLDAVRSLVSEMKSTPVRDLGYEDYLWRTERARKQAEKQAMFRAYGGE